MTIIVTGGAGFIGSNFVFHMLDKYPNYRIVCVDKLTYAGNLSTLAPVMDNPNFRFCKIDICDREAIYHLFEEEHPDMVVNFAAESGSILGHQYQGNRCDDGCMQKIWNPEIPSGINGRSIRRSSTGQTRSVLYGRDTDPYKLPVQQFQSRS